MIAWQPLHAGQHIRHCSWQAAKGAVVVTRSHNSTAVYLLLLLLCVWRNTASTALRAAHAHHPPQQAQRCMLPMPCPPPATGIGEDSIYIGLLEPVPIPRSTSALYVGASGIIVCCDPNFCTTFG